MKQVPMPFLKKEPHDAHIMVHFTRAQLASLRAYATSRDMTVGACVRMMLVAFLNSPLKGKLT
ncbi:MAG: hypothetical protein ACHQC8_06500 [Solirubrobacterales bacterium]